MEIGKFENPWQIWLFKKISLGCSVENGRKILEDYRRHGTDGSIQICIVYYYWDAVVELYVFIQQPTKLNWLYTTGGFPPCITIPRFTNPQPIGGFINNIFERYD